MRNKRKIGKGPAYGKGTPVPATDDLGELREKAAKCQACPLFRNATQTVFGEGGAGVVVFVGEQPGDQEDKVGKPFNNDMDARAPFERVPPNAHRHYLFPSQ
jgi:hypothetical protein